MALSFSLLAHALVIVVARIVDVSLGTLRTVFIVHGRKGPAFFIGFAEILIWIVVVSAVITRGLREPVLIVAYALGFALGTYIGITLEGWFGVGEQVLRVFTRKGSEIAKVLRAEGRAVTVFEGSGLSGPVSMLFLGAPRRDVKRLIASATAIDPGCFYLIDDVRLSSGPRSRLGAARGRWHLLKSK